MVNLTIKQFKETILSKNLLIIYLKFLADIWAEDISYQCKTMWISSLRKQDETFNDFIFFQFLNNKRSPIFELRLNRIYYRSLRDKYEQKKFQNFCLKNNLFLRILNKNRKYLNLILLIVNLNIIFYKILPFSISKIKALKKKRLIFFRYLLHFIRIPIKERKRFNQDLFLDLKDLKKHKISTKQKKFIKINDTELNQILFYFYKFDLFPVLANICTFNKIIDSCNLASSDDEYTTLILNDFQENSNEQQIDNLDIDDNLDGDSNKRE